MLKFKKAFNFKIVSLGIALIFLSTNILYAYPNSNSELLRVPLQYSTSEDKRSSRFIKTISGVAGDTVLDINDPKSSEINLVGGKAASLKELASIAGIKVPKGFNVTTTLFNRYIEILNIRDQIDKLEVLSQDIKANEEEIRELCEEVRSAILNGELDENLKKLIAEFYKNLSSDEEDILVAVRSSATAEDMPNASFAGQYISLLNQRGIDQVIEAIKRVWASTYNFNAVNYIKQNNMQLSKVNMGVLILEMVDAQSSGTAFSVDTETGFTFVSINYYY